MTLGLFTVIVAHATFCIVVIYNNVIAACGGLENLEEASADLGAHTWQTFRHITLPNMQTALVAGALLAFALSSSTRSSSPRSHSAPGKETLPIWIFNNLFRGQQLPITNVVAVIVVLLSIIPVCFAHRLTREESISARGGGGVEPVATAESAVVIN